MRHVRDHRNPRGRRRGTRANGNEAEVLVPPPRARALPFQAGTSGNRRGLVGEGSLRAGEPAWHSARAVRDGGVERPAREPIGVDAWETRYPDSWERVDRAAHFGVSVLGRGTTIPQLRPYAVSRA